MKINWDYWWLERQAWISRMQPRKNDGYVDVVLWCILGLLFTMILMVW